MTGRPEADLPGQPDARPAPSRDGTRAARGRWPGDACAAWALASAVAVIVLALVLPIETVNTTRAGVQPRRSLFSLHGAIVLLPAAAPLAAAVLVCCALYAAREGRRRWALTVAWALSGAVTAAAVIGFLTFLIGVFVLPTGVLLLAATAQARSELAGRATAAARTGKSGPMKSV